MRKTRGFTLIELMVVVIVIAVLAALALPSYLNQTRKSRRNAAQSAMQQIALLEERYRADNTGFLAAPTSASTNWSQLGSYPSPSGTYYGFVVAVTVAAGSTPATYTITATAPSTSTQFKDKYNGQSCATLTYAFSTSGVITKSPGTCWNK